MGRQGPPGVLPTMVDDDKSRSLPSLDEFDARLKRERIAAGLDRPDHDAIAVANSRAAGEGLRVAIEFVVSVLVGTALGFLIGNAFGAKLLGLIIGLIVGFAAGLRTVYRQMMANAAAMEAETSGTATDAEVTEDRRGD